MQQFLKDNLIGVIASTLGIIGLTYYVNQKPSDLTEYLMNDGTVIPIVLDSRVSDPYPKETVVNITERDIYIQTYTENDDKQAKLPMSVISEDVLDKKFEENSKLMVKVTNIWDKVNYKIEIVNFDSKIASLPIHKATQGIDKNAVYYFLLDKKYYDGTFPNNIPDGFKKANDLLVKKYGIILGKATQNKDTDDFIILINGLLENGTLNNNDGDGGMPPGVGTKSPPKL